MIKKYFVLMVLCLFFISFVSSELYYDLNLYYDSDGLVVRNFDVVYSRVSESNFYSLDDDVVSYKIELLDNLGVVVYFENISVPNLAISDSFDSEIGAENVISEEISFNVYLPYSENVNEVVIRDNTGSVVVQENSRIFAKVRGEVVGVSEDKDGDGDVVKRKGVMTFFYFMLFVVIVLIAVLVIVFRRRK